MTRSKSAIARTALLLGLLSTFAAAPVDARRGGSFGSRGARTYSAPRSTRLAPGYTSGMERSMKPRSSYGGAAYAPRPTYAPSSYQNNGRGRFGGFGGGLLTGVLAGGLLGGLFGHGFGGGYGGYGGSGGGGLLGFLIQLALIGGVVWLALRLFRGGRTATAPQQYREPTYRDQPSGYTPSPSYPAAAPAGGDIALDASDQSAFERLLLELQDAFGREDYGRLRAITTPEIMSYLAEELSDNATHGRRNEVSATRLLDGEVSEAWGEGDTEFATIAMRYESIDVMRDRASGAVTSGDDRRPTETTELWTFVRPAGGRDWKVSAIQEA
jgi:predicted lipid-binding transport protein (Tim44 family)